MHDIAEIERGRGIGRVSRLALRWRYRPASLLRGLRQFGRRRAPRHRRAERLGDREAGAQPVLVKAVSGPGAAEPGMALALNLAEPLLRGEGGRVVLRMIAACICRMSVPDRGSNGGLRLTNSGLSSSMPCSRFIQ